MLHVEELCCCIGPPPPHANPSASSHVGCAPAKGGLTPHVLLLTLTTSPSFCRKAYTVLMLFCIFFGKDAFIRGKQKQSTKGRQRERERKGA